MKFIFACVLFLALTPLLRSQTVLDSSTGKIIVSVTGVSDANPNVSGTALGAGVSFDLTIIAKSVTTPILTLTHPADGTGIAGGRPFIEIDNRNNLDSNDDEAMVFTLSPVTGLPAGKPLRISGIDIRTISLLAGCLRTGHA